MNFYLKSVIRFLIVIWLLVSVMFFVAGFYAPDSFFPEQSRKSSENYLFSFSQKGVGLYLEFVKNTFSLNFPQNSKDGRSLRTIISEYSYHSFILWGVALSVSIFIGVFLGLSTGMISPKKKKLLSGFSTLINGIPPFVLSFVLIYIFSIFLPKASFYLTGYRLGFPVSGTGVTTTQTDLRAFLLYLKGLFLPVLTLVLIFSVRIFQIIQLEVNKMMQKDFIMALRARGFSEKRILFKHLLKRISVTSLNSMHHLICLFFSVSLIVEMVFSWPGFGRLLLSSLFQRNHPQIFAIQFILTFLVLAFNLIIEMASYYFDPQYRIREN